MSFLRLLERLSINKSIGEKPSFLMRKLLIPLLAALVLLTTVNTEIVKISKTEYSDTHSHGNFGFL